MKNIGDLKVSEILNETNDMAVNRKVYEEQLKLIPVFNGKDTSKFRHWIKSIEKSVNSGFYNPHRICHMKAEGAVCGCKQGTHPMISYIDEFEELIAGMDGNQTYIQSFVDGLHDLKI